MTIYDRWPDTGSNIVALLAASAALSDIVAPSALYQGQVGHITGYATNTGNVNLTLYADLVDADTGAVITTQGPMSTTPQSPIRTLDLPFTMPNKVFNWYIILRD